MLGFDRVGADPTTCPLAFTAKARLDRNPSVPRSTATNGVAAAALSVSAMKRAASRASGLPGFLIFIFVPPFLAGVEPRSINLGS
jgi:hypothetical protein